MLFRSLYGVYPVFVIEQMFEATLRIRVDYRSVDIVGFVIIGYGAGEYISAEVCECHISIFFRFHSRINYSEPLVVDTEFPGNECGALRLEGFGLYPNAKIGKNRVSGNSGS